ncbi:hypothetical protein CVT24_006594 [Panaeolus cyanescens]|uniref:G domain-containing protein n=1 Tax=Panaeolus cyanescens TaxID=181874 RepID=A0A409XBW7_9AGAR|nr:hypothetical protein CVT24_006594 [Panaeolus cyanescens]
MSTVSLKILEIDGEVSVKQLDSTDTPDGFTFLLAGPTGSGGGSFIEALANDRELGISKNQLESFTQTLTPYKVLNVGHSVYLLDCPGFSDNSLSEFEIIEMVNKWMKANDSLGLTNVSEPREVPWHL